jgi:hypothetical protein
MVGGLVRSHDGKWDILTGAMLREDSARFTDIYRLLLLRAARAEGIDRDRLPDFLDLQDGGEFALLGKDELGTSVFENALRDQIARSAAGGHWPEQDTERIILAAARVGQHVFALNVLSNCGQRCVFCGLNPSAFGAKRMLVAGHIKPWKDSAPSERLDPRNGRATCPGQPRLGTGVRPQWNGPRPIPPTAVPMCIVDGFPQVKTMVRISWGCGGRFQVGKRSTRSTATSRCGSSKT